MKFSVIMPAYMEEEGIEDALEACENILVGFEAPYEIIVVDDGSDDKTSEKACDYVSRHVKVIRCRENLGKGGAIREGFKHVTGDLVIFMDADTDLQAAQIECFLYHLSMDDADVVVGSKAHPLSQVNHPMFRRFSSHGYRFLNKVLFGLDVCDTGVGQKLFKREVLDDVMGGVLVKRHAFDLEILVSAHYRGYKVVEAPVKMNYDFFGCSVDFLAVLNVFVDVCLVFYRSRILRCYDRGKKGKNPVLGAG